MGTAFFELALATCAGTLTPGPNNILLLTSASTFGFQKCRSLLCGIWTGILTVMLICGFGCAFLGTLVPQIGAYAKYAGAVYMLYLAYKTFTRRTVSGETDISKPLTFTNGFLLQFLNIKIVMLGITFYAGYIMPYGFHLHYVLMFAVVVTICSSSSNLIWTTMGSLLFPLYKKHDKLINTVMALLLVWCAWKMAVD